ncbi:MAG: efflux RND transporter periplasmic adaptor subunit [Candidatus Moraniibacteriota bacterium]|nr:MAG: efflux RND transporter periplasmic adaptor subunit [Candidatus Moranbacteria bacterium]
MKKSIRFILGVLLLIGVFGSAIYFSPKQEVSQEQDTTTKSIVVTTQSIEESRVFPQLVTYPATVIGNQESDIVAKSAGTISVLNISLGDHVLPGSFLTKIDDTGNSRSSNVENFQSKELQQANINKEKAQKSVDIAERNYQSLKKIYEEQEDDDTLLKTVTKDQVRSAKLQIDMTKLEKENAEIALQSLLDNHLVTSPLEGYVTNILVSVGDYVTPGETLATISKTKSAKLRLYVDQNHFTFFQKGTVFSFMDGNRKVYKARVENISPQADLITRRFLVEASPEEKTEELLLGTIVSAEFSFEQKPQMEENILLPISAITFGQNENNIFIVENERARRVVVEVSRVVGEMAEIKIDLPRDAKVIVSGNKLVRDGDNVSLSK